MLRPALITRAERGIAHPYSLPSEWQTDVVRDGPTRVVKCIAKWESQMKLTAAGQKKKERPPWESHEGEGKPGRSRT